MDYFYITFQDEDRDVRTVLLGNQHDYYRLRGAIEDSDHLSVVDSGLVANALADIDNLLDELDLL